MEFSHFIITRFNIVYGYQEPNERPGLNAEWLEHRFKLFDDFCVPSVMGQSNREFRWLVLFDELTPEPYKTRISRYEKSARFESVWMKAFDLEAIQAEVLSRVPESVKYVITTRLDNDDAICRDYVSVVQGRFRGQESEVINFSDGYQYDLSCGKTYLLCVPSSPTAFASLIESKSVLRTIYCCDHRNLGQTGPISYLREPLAWLQVIHGRNLGNSVWGRQCSTPRMLRNFDVKIDRGISAAVTEPLDLALAYFLRAGSFVKRRLLKIIGTAH